MSKCVHEDENGSCKEDAVAGQMFCLGHRVTARSTSNVRGGGGGVRRKAVSRKRKASKRGGRRRAMKRK